MRKLDQLLKPTVRMNLALLLALMGLPAIILGSILSWNFETAPIDRPKVAAFEETIIASTAADVAAPAVPTKPVSITPAPGIHVDSMKNEEMTRSEDAIRALAKKELEERILTEQNAADRRKDTKRKFKEELKKKYPKLESKCSEEDFKDTLPQQRKLEKLFDNFNELENMKTRIKLPASPSYLRCVENQIADETKSCKTSAGFDEENADSEPEDDPDERKKLRAARKELLFCLRRVVRFKARVFDRRISESKTIPSQLLDILKEAVVIRANEKSASAQDSQQAQSLFQDSIFNSVGVCGPSYRANDKVNCLLQSLWPHSEGLVASRFTIPLFQEAYMSFGGTLPSATLDTKVRSSIPKSPGLLPNPRSSNKNGADRSRKLGL